MHVSLARGRGLAVPFGRSVDEGRGLRVPTLVLLALLCALSACCETATRRRIVESSLDEVLGTRLAKEGFWCRDDRADEAAKEVADLVEQYEEGEAKGFSDDYELAVSSAAGEKESRKISGEEAHRTLLRNRIAFLLLAQIRSYHESNYNDLYTGAFGVETFVDWSVLALGGWGAFAPEGTSQVLSGVSAGLVGAESAVSANALNDLNKFQLILKMLAIRAKTRAGILKRLNLPDSEYPLHKMALDMQALLEDGSIRQAATETAQQAAVEIVEALEAQEQALDALGAFQAAPAVPQTEEKAPGAQRK